MVAEKGITFRAPLLNAPALDSCFYLWEWQSACLLQLTFRLPCSTTEIITSPPRPELSTSINHQQTDQDQVFHNAALKRELGMVTDGLSDILFLVG